MMVQPGDDNCVSTGKEREDRQVESKNRFDALQIDVKCPNTAILLLGSRERPVLVAAAAALTKFAAKGKDHLQTLFELDVVDSLMPLIEHEDLCTRRAKEHAIKEQLIFNPRFAMRLLAEMAAMPLVRNHLLESPSCIPGFANILTNDPDMFMQEYASLILAEISKEPYGTVKLLQQSSTFDFLFEKIKQPDPDIKKNNIEILDNLLKDPIAAEQIAASQAFSFPLIYQLLKEPYPAIQTLALSVVESLVSRSKDDRIQKFFQESAGLGVLLGLLENVEFANLHSDILRIFMHAAENPKTIESLSLDGGVGKLFKYLENTANSLESREVLDVLVRLANTQPGRKTLHSFGIVSTLLRNLRYSRDSEVRRIACYGVGMMSRHEPAAEEIMEDNPTKMILDVLKDESMKWPTREAAAFALKELCIGDEKNCQIFLEVKGQTYLQSFLKQPFGKVPLEIVVTAVDILAIIGGYPDLRERLIEVELIDALCGSFEAKDRAADALKIACCKALSAFCVEKRARQLCLTKNVAKRLFVLLQTSESIPVRATAVQLVQQLCGDRAMAEQFVQAGYLNYMLKNRAATTFVPSWETCIEALFSAHLPVKFAATGRLSLHEITQDGFYVMRRHICPFPILDELFRLKMCPMEPVYVVNFTEPRVSLAGERLLSSAEVKTSFEATSAWLDVKFGILQTDPYLYQYLELFKCILAANEADEPITETRPTVVNISKLASRAKLLGIFVARQMSGPDPENPCVDHQLDIHVREIREDIQTSVIPLGQLRVGSYLERALLFKVMADRISLPAALVRGEYGKAWIEIAIPEIDNPVDRPITSSLPEVLVPRLNASKKNLMRTRRKSDSLEEPKISQDIQQDETDRVRVIRDNLKTVLPKRLLCENYIVDLLENPGDLIPIDSARARVYSAPVSHCVMTCDV